ncbi:MAG: hypothetical protein ACLQM6_07110 [Acidobacteriaceae bacterium]
MKKEGPYELPKTYNEWAIPVTIGLRSPPAAVKMQSDIQRDGEIRLPIANGGWQSLLAEAQSTHLAVRHATSRSPR